MKTPIPTSLLATLAKHFNDQSFTLFAVMTHAPIAEINDWKVGLQAMIDSGSLSCIESRMLGDVYIMTQRGATMCVIPVDLTQVLACQFCGRLFVAPEVLVYAPQEDVAAWCSALKVLVALGILNRVLGDMFVSVVVGGAE